MKEDLVKIYTAAIKAVDPYNSVMNVLKLNNNTLSVSGREYNLDKFKNIYIAGAGKATSPMAKAVEELLGARITSGLICVKYGYTEDLKIIQIREAAHPVPDAAGKAAAAEITSMLVKADEKDLVISLISGGGSALLPQPVDSVALDDKIAVTNLLLKSGASIHEMNCVRKHLSLVKGGGLARFAYPATVINLMISDVVGDRMDVIASGPFTADLSTFDDALEIIAKYNLSDKMPKSVNEYIKNGAEGKNPETPDVSDKCFEKVQNVICSSNIIALKAAEKTAREIGYNTIILSSLIEGDNISVVKFHEAVMNEVILSDNPIKSPACVLSGGESTVIVNGNGLGGRNMEFAMHMIDRIAGERRIVAASIGTDGSDGPTDAAGAFADNQMKDYCSINSIDYNDYMNKNDSYHLFEKTGGLIKTGPTNTNVMDVRIMLIK